MIAGCYTLDLYCDNEDDHRLGGPAYEYDEFPHRFIAEHGSTCRRRARRAGWKLTRDGNAFCPKCSGKKKRAPK